MAYLALSPVSVAVYALLNVAGLIDLVGNDLTGRPRIYDDVPQPAMFPFVWYEVRERDVRGFGTGGLPEVELSVHAFSQYEGAKEAQDIIQKVIQLLRDQALTVTGYTHAGLIFYDDTVLLSDEVIAGVKCRELVARFRIYVKEN